MEQLLEGKLFNLVIDPLALRYRIFSWHLDCFLFDTLGKMFRSKKKKKKVGKRNRKTIFKDKYVETTVRENIIGNRSQERERG